MGALKIKEELIHLIEEGDNRLLKMLYAVAKEYNRMDFTLPGDPMSEDELKERVFSAKKRIESGQFTTQEQLEKEMKEW